jgi:hypothetical protein
MHQPPAMRFTSSNTRTSVAGVDCTAARHGKQKQGSSGTSWGCALMPL